MEELVKALAWNEHVKRSRKTYGFSMTNPDGTPRDISNDYIKIWITDKFQSTTALIEKTIAPGDHTDPENGKTQFEITAGDTEDLPAGEEEGGKGSVIYRLQIAYYIGDPAENDPIKNRSMDWRLIASGEPEPAP